MELPTTPELIERLTAAMDEAHLEWEGAASPSATIGTRALKRRIWEIGFDYRRVYPTANRLGRGAAAHARSKLEARPARYRGPREEHSTVKEFQYDVAWSEYDAEYTGDEVPAFKRLVLALESENGGEWEVLLDFHKLLSARAELRVMVWDADRVRDGYAKLERRREQADGANEGYWLLSGWSTRGFEHRKYRGTTRLHQANEQGTRRWAYCSTRTAAS